MNPTEALAVSACSKSYRDLQFPCGVIFTEILASSMWGDEHVVLSDATPSLTQYSSY